MKHSCLCCVVIIFYMAALVAESSSDKKNIIENISLDKWNQGFSQNSKMLVVFYQEIGCDLCPSMINAVASLIGDPDLDEDIKVLKSADPNLVSHLSLTAFPVVVFLRQKSYTTYQGKASVESLVEWLHHARSKVTQELYDDSFEHLTQASTGATTGDWLVAFYQNSCSHILPVMENVGVSIHQRTNVAVVDSSKNKILTERFSIKKCPQIILFKQGKMYRYEIPKLDELSLKSFVEGWYKNSKAETVLPPKSSFDYLTEHIARELKTQLEGPNRNKVLLGLCGVAAFFVLLLVCCFRTGASVDNKQKKE